MQNQDADTLIASSSRALSAGIRMGREEEGPVGRGRRGERELAGGQAAICREQKGWQGRERKEL